MQTTFISTFQLAYVEDLNGPWLFDSMYADDPEADKLGALPGMEELRAAYPLKQANTESESYDQIGNFLFPFLNSSVSKSEILRQK